MYTSSSLLTKLNNCLHTYPCIFGANLKVCRAFQIVFGLHWLLAQKVLTSWHVYWSLASFSFCRLTMERPPDCPEHALCYKVESSFPLHQASWTHVSFSQTWLKQSSLGEWNLILFACFFISCCIVMPASLDFLVFSSRKQHRRRSVSCTGQRRLRGRSSIIEKFLSSILCIK